MTLLRLRKRLKFALRGHKLLKDKQEQLTKEFNNLIIELKNLRYKLEEELDVIYSYFRIVLTNFTYEQLENMFKELSVYYNFEIETKKVIRHNIKYNYDFLKKTVGDKKFLFVCTDLYFNLTVIRLLKIYELLVQLGNLETFCYLIAKELEVIRRRVNALEYVLIPQIKSSIKYIINKLNEFERTNITQLMRIKQLMEEK